MDNEEKGFETISPKQRGGARPGAGAKPGVPRKRKCKIPSGLTSLEFMRALMNDTTQDARLRFEAAKNVAPYEHGRLQSVEHTGKDGEAIQIILGALDAEL